MKLRGTQSIFIDKAVEELKSSKTRKSVFVAPVAYGKSICIAKIVERLKENTIILQPNREILLQNFEKYVEYGNKASIFCSSLKEKLVNKIPYVTIDNKLVKCKQLSNVTFATVKSLVNVIEEVKAFNFKYLIIDECHVHTRIDSEIKKLIRATKIKNILGVTATPVILTSSVDGATLKMMDSYRDNLFSNIEHVVQVQEMVKSNFWCPIVYKIKNLNLTNLKYNASGSDFTEESINESYIVNNIELECANAIKYCKKHNRKSILIFAPDIEKAEGLKKSIPNSEIVHSRMNKSKRSKIINDFKSLKIPILINVQILTVGFNHPELDTIILLRPTASISLYYQIIGRVTRIHPKKENGWVIDLSGNLQRFGKIEHLNYEYIEGYGWGLFSKDRLLTGTPIQLEANITKDCIRKKLLEKEPPQIIKDLENNIFTFGKYKGKPFRLVPLPYILYILENFQLLNKFRQELETYYKFKLNSI